MHDREQRFGTGGFGLHAIDLGTANYWLQAEHFGNQVGCPVAYRLIEERGPQVMASLYAEVLLYYQMVINKLNATGNQNMANFINRGYRRLADQPLAVYDPEAVPEWNHTIIPGPETPAGYALPRLVNLVVWETSMPGTTMADRLSLADELLGEAISELNDLDDEYDLTVLFADKIFERTDADPKLILRRTISEGKLEQDSLSEEFSQIITSMRYLAPDLWDVYSAMSIDERRKLGIAVRPLKHFDDQPITFVESIQVSDMVVCDSYAFDGNSRKDLGIIKIQPGGHTPLQEVLQGRATIEGLVSGNGRLEITRANGNQETYVANDKLFNQIRVNVGKGDRMQWFADENSALVAYEICLPRYAPGRFKDIG